MTTRQYITKIRDAAGDLDKVARRFEKDSKPDRVIGNAIDHLYAMAAGFEAKMTAPSFTATDSTKP